MMETKNSKSMSPGLCRVAARAKRDSGQLISLAHHIDVDALRRGFHRLDGKKAIGVDGVSKEAYGQNLEENLLDLHARLKTLRYRHQPIRRVHIPKGRGETRPIGIATTEDKIVQGALYELLQAIYEQDFLDCSYGFRPGRNPHQSLRKLSGAIHSGDAAWILEFDIASFFDSLDRPMLKEMLQTRIADKSLMRLVGKCLAVGVFDGETFSLSKEGTVQGSGLSPMLGNIYLHHVLDVWVEQDVRPRLRGSMTYLRFADDGIFGFTHHEDALRVMQVLGKRLARYGLTLHATKTRLVDFRRPPSRQQGGKGGGTFDFLGFTHYWRRSRKGKWFPQVKTQRARLQRTKVDIANFCRRQRHKKVWDQHKTLRRKVQGHFNYFGVRGNERSLDLLAYSVRCSWFKWLNRRSQRSRLDWPTFIQLLKRYPLPLPRAKVDFWEPSL